MVLSNDFSRSSTLWFFQMTFLGVVWFFQMTLWFFQMTFLGVLHYGSFK